MRQFFKFMFASMLGTLLLSVLMFILFIGFIAALGSAFSLEGKAPSVPASTVLRIALDQEVLDRGPNDPFNLDFAPFKMSSKLGLDDILNNLEKAKRDDRIRGIFLDLGVVNAGFTTVKEIRDKLLDFKAESGKPVVAFADVYTQKSYYLASAADAVYLVPQGDLDLRGLRSEMMFYAGLFEKLDVQVQFIRGSDNKFKSFGEAFTRKDMSPASKLQTTALLTGIWSNYIAQVGEARHMDTTKLNAIAAGLLVRKAEDAVSQGLVDSLAYRDQVLASIKQRMGLDTGKDIEFMELGKYTKAYVAKAGPGGSSSWKQPKVAVVYAQGDIIDGESTDGSIGGATISAAIRQARKDTAVKAIVLRVNSPGGSGLASDVIWREVVLAKAEKPVVVSMGDVAASGGYYISCAADKIFAEPTTITGSIGVFGMIPNMKGFFNNKLGLTFDGVETHKYAGMMTVTRPLTEEEKGIIQGFIDNFYHTFTQRVADGRKLAVAQVDSIGQGRVWTGASAQRIGLVDEMGGLQAATAEAARMVGLEPGGYRTVGFPEQKDFFEQLRSSLDAQARTWVAKQAFGEDAEMLHRFEQVRQVRNMAGIQARMPFAMEVY
ncbi:MAG: signal peptide peptidase SppA [Bacteroidetes bacterium]|nr:signal peptide peptidase SppA [Bacteroidota bacterium]